MLSIDDVKKVAQLAKFNLQDPEIGLFQRLLGQALDYLEVLKKVDVSHVESTYEVTGLENIGDTDFVRDSLSQEEALQNAAKTERGFFVVPPVLKKTYEEAE